LSNIDYTHNDFKNQVKRKPQNKIIKVNFKGDSGFWHDKELQGTRKFKIKMEGKKETNFLQLPFLILQFFYRGLWSAPKFKLFLTILRFTNQFGDYECEIRSSEKAKRFHKMSGGSFEKYLKEFEEQGWIRVFRGENKKRFIILKGDNFGKTIDQILYPDDDIGMG